LATVPDGPETIEREIPAGGRTSHGLSVLHPLITMLTIKPAASKNNNFFIFLLLSPVDG